MFLMHVFSSLNVNAVFLKNGSTLDIQYHMLQMDSMVTTVFRVTLYARLLAVVPALWGIPMQHSKFFVDPFTFGCAGSSLPHRLFPGRGGQGLLSSCSAWALRGWGVSRRRARAAGGRASAAVAPGSAARAQQLRPTASLALWHVRSSWARDRTTVSCAGSRFFFSCRATRKPPVAFLKRSFKNMHRFYLNY